MWLVWCSAVARVAECGQIGRHGGRIVSVTAWAGLRAFWKGQAGGKPKGMHWRTYERLFEEHDTFEDLVNRSFIARFGPMLKKGVF